MLNRFFLISKSLILALPFLFSANSVYATEKWFEIEIIVFQQPKPSQPITEKWQAGLISTSIENSVELFSTEEISSLLLDIETAQPLPYQLLPFEVSTLKQTLQRLQQNGYHLLTHKIWQQPITSPKLAKPIHIFGGNLQRTTNFEQQAINWELDGTVTFSQQRFINFQTDLILTKKADELTGYLPKRQTTQPLSFRLIQKRRLQTKLLHYFDHPLFGILVKFTPIEREQVDEVDPDDEMLELEE